jgi:hypothetical membrane protein
MYEKLTKYQSFICSFLFISVFILFASITKFKITEIQLSHFGAYTDYNLLWNLTIMILSISIYYNFKNYLDSKSKIFLKDFFLDFAYFMSLCLFIVGFIPMPSMIHTICAYFYFFFYPLFIYLFAYFNRLKLKESWYLFIISLLMIIIPLIFIPMFKGKAYSEIIHSFFMIIFHVFINRKANLAKTI